MNKVKKILSMAMIVMLIMTLMPLSTTTVDAASKKSISKATVTLSSQSYVYDGKAKNPSVKVKYGSKVLKSGKDYTVKHSSNTNPGTDKVTVTGKGSYKGSVTKKFSIVQQIKLVSSYMKVS